MLLLSMLAVSASLFVCYSTPAYAVIPSLLGPLQGLMAILPQILVFIAAGFAALFSLRRWRLWFTCRPKAKTVIVLAILVVIGGSFAGLLIRRLRPESSIVAVGGGNGSSVPVEQSWPAFRGGLTRTGNIDHQSGPKTGEEIWVFRDPDFLTGNYSSSPAIIGNRVYAGSSQGSIFSSGGIVYCLDAESGDMIWRYQTQREIFSSPAVVDGKVYIGEGLHRDVDSKLYCLDAASGSFHWSFQTSSHVESSPTVVGGKVFFGGGEDGVYCVDAVTGEQIWRHPGIHVDV